MALVVSADMRAFADAVAQAQAQANRQTAEILTEKFREFLSGRGIPSDDLARCHVVYHEGNNQFRAKVPLSVNQADLGSTTSPPQGYITQFFHSVDIDKIHDDALWGASQRNGLA